MKECNVLAVASSERRIYFFTTVKIKQKYAFPILHFAGVVQSSNIVGIHQMNHVLLQVVHPFTVRFILSDMKDIPTSVSYNPPDCGVDSALCVGDDAGDVFVVHFLKQFQSLFKNTALQEDTQVISCKVEF